MEQNQKGTLYLAATPIGNLEDITYRVVRILNEVDIIAAEDTRVTQKLCNHYSIERPLTSYHEHNKATSGTALLKRLREGQHVALVSDAGTPAVSDPGYDLVVQAIKEGVTVVPLPGASAAVTALIASGLPTERFYFLGFLPRKEADKRNALQKAAETEATLLFYESPHRVKDTLWTIKEAFVDCEVVAARELTKKFEQFVRGSADDVLTHFTENAPKGEFCIVVSQIVLANDENEVWWAGLSTQDHVQTYVAKGHTSKEAIKLTAVDRDLPKRDVYATFHISTEADGSE
ncbi:16S rRNA (cytidine(1402)-2'-O)-methyltransferase [Aureibacillus halotolerans]|uniref:Ribosomal RNA small subunit methyltransferase I n=1 Tax=Aureibacillus halotolerans TaxID=1508390 RepID=A0A4R6TXL2_9BACI|nr:16S rRNA (cytidine(1402)-2'-O)-methyltransferase [Aureibacillus halotolerans]TDQ34245.1 16S rRNA (cytidine1402-2'-O)-methyltransferase [Aureibacillus halotolerans]